MTDVRVKICGVTSAEDAAAAVAAGADYIGLNFFPPASRAISFDQAQAILDAVPEGVERTALFVDPDDDMIGRVKDPVYTLIQLHGQETPSRVSEIRARTGLPIMKVVSVREAEDLAALDAYLDVADQLLIDAKAPKGSNIPGGHGVPFDWSILATQVDVASGVEARPGVKDTAKMAAFVAAAKG